MDCPATNDRLWDLLDQRHAGFLEHRAQCRECDRRSREWEQVQADLQQLVGQSESPAPESIGSFEIQGILGRGGMGVVYHAEQRDPRRPVALKVIRGEIEPSELSRAWFQREIEILAKLEHGNIVSIYEAGETSTGQRYFAMELVRGRTWESLARDSSVSLARRLELFCKVCAGVRFAHLQGVIHQDLKPANILIDERGEPKILDFGLARVFDEGFGGSGERKSIRHMGTPPYMSPEQRQAGTIDLRSDVYALGVILREWTIASGHRGRSALFDAELKAILSLATAEKREDRYASVEALERDLIALQADEPISAFGNRMGYLFWKFALRNKAAVGASVLLFGLLIFFGYTQWTHARHRAQQLEQNQGLTDKILFPWLQAERDQLWPIHPDRVAAMSEWLELARGLRIRQAGRVEGQAALAKIDEWIAAIEHRRSVASTLARDSLETPRQEWLRALEQIRASGHYHGLSFEPQLGLVPLGVDPASGLWEFWHLASGNRPQRQTDTEDWQLEASTGIVLVLIPGGELPIAATAGAAHGSESDSISVAPFFLSKYELSQAQWQRFMQQNPSCYQPGSTARFRAPIRRVSELHPVEAMTWKEAAEAVRRMNLELPRQPEWKHALLLGHPMRRNTPGLREQAAFRANLGDRNWGRRSRKVEQPLPWDDGFEIHAPIGHYRADRLGLHDMIGNVAEWSRTRLHEVLTPTELRDLAGIDARTAARAHTWLGSSYKTTQPEKRSLGTRWSFDQYNEESIGVRPKLSIAGAWTLDPKGEGGR